jgi:hypothetical protein
LSFLILLYSHVLVARMIDRERSKIAFAFC